MGSEKWSVKWRNVVAASHKKLFQEYQLIRKQGLGLYVYTKDENSKHSKEIKIREG